MSRSTTITIGDAQFTVAAMNLGQIEDAMPSILALRSGDPAGQITALLNVLQIALHEGNPEVNVRKLQTDLTGLRAAFSAVMDISGFETKAVAPGEAQAPVTSTSAGSLAPSLPAADSSQALPGA